MPYKDIEKVREANRKSYYKHKEQRLLKIKEYREENADLVKEKSRNYQKRNKERLRLYQEEWRKNNRDKLKLYVKKYRDNNKATILKKARIAYRENIKKNQAKGKIASLIRSGKLIKESCFVCGNIKSEGHHDNYDKPLDVIWLCHLHHKQLHASMNKTYRKYGNMLPVRSL